jgi:hypothetical protein
MFDTELYQQVLGLTAPWRVADARLDVESTEIHVHVEHPEGCRWSSPRSVAVSWHATTMPLSGSGGIPTLPSSTHCSTRGCHESSARSPESCRPR